MPYFEPVENLADIAVFAILDLITTEETLAEFVSAGGFSFSSLEVSDRALIQVRSVGH